MPCHQEAVSGSNWMTGCIKLKYIGSKVTRTEKSMQQSISSHERSSTARVFQISSWRSRHPSQQGHGSWFSLAISTLSSLTLSYLNQSWAPNQPKWSTSHFQAISLSKWYIPQSNSLGLGGTYKAAVSCLGSYCRSSSGLERWGGWWTYSSKLFLFL